ncbi:hypothetical protein FMUND_2315 [Fusarium mundagurra]|uniref:Uncharacterized protein n=1 Tax=Fusarium mundagurra TaxID=1567541 RepID=A0A8H5Z2B7_9HYPO|nr:hypothetical protein FMUND_2315 [Fusarium mundagurra]
MKMENRSAKLTEYGLATLTDTQLLELLEMDLESPKPRMHTSTSRDWQIAMSRLLSKLLADDERVDKLKSLPIVQLRDGSWTSPASGPLYFPTSGHRSIPESLKFRDVTLLATFQPERRTSYEKLGVIQPKVKEVRERILDIFKSAETLPLEDVYEYLRYLYLTYQSFNLFTPHEQPYDAVRVLMTGMKLQNPHSTTVYYPGTDDPYSPETLLGPAPMASLLYPKIWNDGADKPGPFYPTWKVWLCDSVGIWERLSLLQAETQSESEPTNDGSSTDTDDRLLGFIECKTATQNGFALQNVLDFFIEKLGVKRSAYDELLNPTSDSPEDIKEMIMSFAEEFDESPPKFAVEPIRWAKIFPVRSPNGEVSLLNLDTDFAIADRDGLRRELKDHIRILDFDLADSRWLRPFFQWLNIDDRYLSRCVRSLVTVSADGASSEEVDPWDLRLKTCHITRVAATFDIFATYDDAASLYERLKTLRVIEVSNISAELEITQDQKALRSRPQSVTAHISDDQPNFTIYVAKDKKKKIFSVLPRILEEWLRQDSEGWHTFEVISSLTSIIASDMSVLDEILEDEGIIELPFENYDTDGANMASEGTSECVSVKEVAKRPSEEDRGELLVLRGCVSASEDAAKDGVM